MNTANNARSAASKQRIMEALEALLSSKNIELITVKEICAEAKVNRTTFYAHYSNVQDLLEAFEKQLMTNAGENILPQTRDAEQLTGRETMTRLLRFIRENEMLYRIYLFGDSESKLIKTFSEQVKTGFIIPVLDKSNLYTKAEYDYQYAFCKEGTLGIIRKWLADGCREPEKQVAVLLEKMLRRCMP